MKDYFNHSLSEIPYLGQTLYLLNTFAISSSLQPSITDRVLPLFMLTFIGPLVANIYHKYFTLNIDNLIIFIFALVLGTSKFTKIVFNRHVRMLLSVISKSLLIVDVRNRKDDVVLYVVWLLINTFIGMGVYKIVKSEPLTVADNEIMEMFGVVSVMCLARKFQLNEAIIFVMIALLVFTCNESKNCIFDLKQRMKEEQTDEKDREEQTDEKDSEENVSKRGRRGRPRKDEKTSVDESQNSNAGHKMPATPRRKAARKLTFDEE